MGYVGPVVSGGAQHRVLRVRQPDSVITPLANQLPL